MRKIFYVLTSLLLLNFIFSSSAHTYRISNSSGRILYVLEENDWKGIWGACEHAHKKDFLPNWNTQNRTQAIIQCMQISLKLNNLSLTEARLLTPGYSFVIPSKSISEIVSKEVEKARSSITTSDIKQKEERIAELENAVTILKQKLSHVEKTPWYVSLAPLWFFLFLVTLIALLLFIRWHQQKMRHAITLSRSSKEKGWFITIPLSSEVIDEYKPETSHLKLPVHTVVAPCGTELKPDNFQRHVLKRCRTCENKLRGISEEERPEQKATGN